MTRWEMSEITRWTLSSHVFGSEMVKQPGGAWVKHSDHESDKHQAVQDFAKKVKDYAEKMKYDTVECESDLENYCLGWKESTLYCFEMFKIILSETLEKFDD
jgi:hypothetical protein